MSERKISFTESGAIVISLPHYNDVIAFGTAAIPSEHIQEALKFGWKQIPQSADDMNRSLFRVARNILTARIYAR